MKFKLRIFIVILLVGIYCSSAHAGTIIMHVDDENSGTPPYANKGDAAPDIQTAIDYITNWTGAGRDLTSIQSNVIIYVYATAANDEYDTEVRVGVNAENTYTTSETYDIKILNFPGETPLHRAQPITFEGNYITLQGFEIDMDVATVGTAIDIGGNYNTVRGCLIYDSRVDVIKIQGTNNLVVGNIISDITINNLAYSIRFLGANSFNNRAVSNIIYNSISFGLSFGNDSFNNIAERNIIYNCDRSGVIFRDDAKNNYLINNIIYNNADGITLNDGNHVINNTIYNNTGNGVQLSGSSFDTVGMVILNNIVSHNANWGIKVSDSGNLKFDEDFDFNLIVSNGNGPIESDFPWADYGSGNITNINISPDYISVTPPTAPSAAPPVIDPDFLRINSTSTCIDRGTDPSSHYSVTTDYWGEARPFDDTSVVNYNSTYDIGADEYFIIGDVTNLVISKSTFSTTLQGSASTPKPGATLTYKLTYNNIGTVTVNDIWIRDYIPAGTSYKADSLKLGLYNDTYVDASTLSDGPSGGSSDEGHYDSATDRVFFTPVNSGSSDPSGDNIAPTESGSMFFQVVVSNKATGTAINNTMTSIGANITNGTAGPVTTIVADMYGGRMSFADDETNFTGTTTIWTMWITNKGNLTTTFDFSEQVISTFNSAPGDWPITFSAADTGALAMGASFEFTVSVTPAGSVPSGAWIDFDIIADTGSTETNYIGDDTLPYGGDIGETNNGIMASSLYGKIVQQGNTLNGPAVRLWRILSGATLSLTKSVSNVRLDGNLISAIVPGSTVTYTIWYSNQGPAAMNQALIYDAIPGNMKYLSMDVLGDWTNQFTTDPSPSQAYNSGGDYSTASDGVDPTITFVRWKHASLAIGDTGKLVYKVIVK